MMLLSLLLSEISSPRLLRKEDDLDLVMVAMEEVVEVFFLVD